MDGAELIEHIIAIRGDVPLLVMTGFVESARLRVLEQFPVRAVLRKPVSRDELARALTQHVPARS
jgi:CheY-like chemotaxis protein